MLAHLSRRLGVRLAPTCYRTTLSISATSVPLAGFAQVSFSTTITPTGTITTNNGGNGNTLTGAVRLRGGGISTSLFADDDGTGGYVGSGIAGRILKTGKSTCGTTGRVYI